MFEVAGGIILAVIFFCLLPTILSIVGAIISIPFILITEIINEIRKITLKDVFQFFREILTFMVRLAVFFFVYMSSIASVMLVWLFAGEAMKDASGVLIPSLITISLIALTGLVIWLDIKFYVYIKKIGWIN